MNLPYYSLTLVTQRQDRSLDDYLSFIHSCAHAGITALQLREKNTDYATRLSMGQQLQSILKPFDIPLIVNDDIQLAIELDANGVHLGQSDGCPLEARQRLGSDKIIGVSIDSLENLQTANELPINYVGIGAIFATQNKPDIATVWGTEGLKTLVSLSKHPVIAIGGINELNAASVMQTGSDGVAVIGAIHNALSPINTIKNLRQIIEFSGVKHA